jgi:hypothetical protein
MPKRETNGKEGRKSKKGVVGGVSRNRESAELEITASRQ